MLQLYVLFTLFFALNAYDQNLLLLAKQPNHALAHTLNEKAGYTTPLTAVNRASNAFFTHYPKLNDHIAYIDIVQQTPVDELSFMGMHVQVKRDDLSATLYGGNKIRKLAFLLADAYARNARTIITFGAAGSNHALATSAYSSYLDMNCICLLKPQEINAMIQRVLLTHAQLNTRLYYYQDTLTRALAAIVHWIDIYNTTGTYPYVIPTGGSCPLGALGFVAAAFELKEQIQAGLQVPQTIYIACGSAGTVAGLALGLALAHIPTRIVAVAVEPDTTGFVSRLIYGSSLEQRISQLIQETWNLLITHDPDIEKETLTHIPIEICTEHTGPQYGIATAQTIQAQKLFEKEGILLDTTYTAKAAAALIYDRQRGIIQHQNTVMLWNTYYPTQNIGISYTQLPTCFYAYFR